MSTTCLKFLLEAMAQTVAAPDTQADLMEGSDGNDTLVGDAGSDDLLARGGDDYLDGEVTLAQAVNNTNWRLAA